MLSLTQTTVKSVCVPRQRCCINDNNSIFEHESHDLVLKCVGVNIKLPTIFRTAPNVWADHFMHKHEQNHALPCFSASGFT